MSRRTTTHKLKQAISNNLLQIKKVQIYNKDMEQTKIVDADTFNESLDSLCESIFSDCIGWYYEKNHGSDGYIAECGRLDGNVENIVTVYLRVNDGVDRESVDKMLSVIEEE